MEIKYVSSSGKEFNLNASQMRVTSGTLHKYKWKPDVMQAKLGDTLYGFTKEACIYSLTVTFRGPLGQRKAQMDELRNAFEYDVVHVAPGRVYFGDCYIECFATESAEQISGDSPRRSENAVDLYCPYPFWIEERTQQFFAGSGEEGYSQAYLDYEYDYSYDYKKSEPGVIHWMIDHYATSNFQMVIYGECINPEITVNGHVYRVYDTLEEGEYIVIKSKEKTIEKHLGNGTIQNIFDNREKESSVFEQMPAGDVLVTWNAEFGFDITLYIERSSPSWI